MTLLEKVLFVADYISADRDYPGVEDMRLAADRSLEEAMVEGILFTVNELMEQRLPVAAESIQAYNDAILLLETQKELLWNWQKRRPLFWTTKRRSASM